MAAFAMNSILTRMALDRGLIDAPGFTTVRLATGALALTGLVRWSSGSVRSLFGGGARGPLALFLYALPFSYAYLRIGAATGALILFGAVQLTMIGWGLLRGERPGAMTWVGLVIALGGLLSLMLPAASRPDPLGAFLMVVAGIGWGVYSLLGQGIPDPVAANARAFLWSLPLALLVSALSFRAGALHARGIVLASISGALTSGLGYAIWYRALRGLTATRAAILQLSVPVIAAVCAALMLGERPSATSAACGATVLVGVGLSLLGRSRRRV